MARVVLDANVLVSAAFGGVPLDAVTKAFARGKVFVSAATIGEIERTIDRLSGKLGRERAMSIGELWRRLFSICTLALVGTPLALCRDPADDAYLSPCASVGADYLVTGDRDLLAVDPGRAGKMLERLKIVTPRQFVESDD